MALRSVVPAPASIEASGAAPLALDASTPIRGDADATQALQALVGARKGLTLPAAPASEDARPARAIVLEIAGDARAESYRLGYIEPIDGMDAKARGFVVADADRAKLILSPADAIYLDMKFDADSPLGLTWARGVMTAQRSYEWEPAEVIDGIGDDELPGVEAPLWTETARTLGDIDALAFPRIASAAEAAWSPAATASTLASELRTWESFAARVGALGPLWSAQGIGFSPLDGIAWAVEVSAGPAGGDGVAFADASRAGGESA
ncbi:family 20 glycosylhydrolase [Microbacterium lacticum]